MGEGCGLTRDPRYESWSRWQPSRERPSTRPGGCRLLRLAAHMVGKLTASVFESPPLKTPVLCVAGTLGRPCRRLEAATDTRFLRIDGQFLLGTIHSSVRPIARTTAHGQLLMVE